MCLAKNYPTGCHTVTSSKRVSHVYGLWDRLEASMMYMPTRCLQHRPSLRARALASLRLDARASSLYISFITPHWLRDTKQKQDTVPGAQSVHLARELSLVLMQYIPMHVHHALLLVNLSGLSCDTRWCSPFFFFDVPHQTGPFSHPPSAREPTHTQLTIYLHSPTHSSASW